jgi:hypothetical protein
MTGRWVSRPAVEWALRDAPGVPARLVSTLVAVAAAASEDGTGAYPSAATVALITRKSVSQAGRDIAALVRLGLLLPGDAGLVKNIRADRRPKVYDVPLSRAAPRRTPSKEARPAPRRGPSKEAGAASGARTGRIPPPNGPHRMRTKNP